MRKVIPMTGNEFVERLLKGERDFSGIRLEDWFNLTGHEKFPKLQDHLLRSKLWNEPIILDAADLRYLQAGGIYWPFLRAEFADFRGANLEKSNLFRAKLGHANLFEASIQHSNSGSLAAGRGGYGNRPISRWNDPR